MIRRLGFLLALFGIVLVWAYSDQLFPVARVSADTARVLDGDTFVLGEETVRLYGVDAIELRQVCQDRNGFDWACGSAARAALVSMVADGDISCNARARDRYERLIATCSSAGESDLGEALVAAGLAISPGERGSAPYESAQDSAREARRGIWQGRFTAPAQWREQHPREEVGAKTRSWPGP